MTKKIKFYFKDIKKLLSTDIYKGLFLFIFLTSIVVNYSMPSDLTFENAILYSFGSPLFQLLVMIVLYISSLNTLKIFDTKFSIILRYKNKKQYLSNLLTYITLINLVLYIFSILSMLIVLMVAFLGRISFTQFPYYQMPFFVYNIFSVFKYFIIINLLCIICILLHKSLNKVFGIVSFALILILKEGYPYSIDVITNFKQVKLFFGYYLYPFQYSNFSLEVCAMFLQIIILLIICNIIFFFMNKYNKINLSE